MAKFIEYKSKPWWNALHMFCVMVLIPLLAVFLFLQGVVSTIGFVLVIACGYRRGHYFSMSMLRDATVLRSRSPPVSCQSSQRSLWTTPFWSFGKTPSIELCCSFSPSVWCS